MPPAKQSRGDRLPPSSRFLISAAGVLGASGIAVGAAGSHAGGGDLARLSSTFLLIHAVAVLVLGLGASTVRPAWIFLWPGVLLAVGAAAFGGDLAVLSLAGSHAFRVMAPIGGMAMIAGWLALAFLPWVVRSAVQDRLSGRRDLP